VLENHEIRFEELKESRVYEEARDNLMRSEGHEFLDYLEKLANESGYMLVKTKEAYSQDLEDFPIEDIMVRGCFVTGGRGVGKSNLIKLLTMNMIRAKIQVKVFDPSLAWKDFPLSKTKVRRKFNLGSEWNRIYDISRLSVVEAREYVRNTLERDLIEAIRLTDLGMKPKALVVIEEAQNIIPSHSLRSKKFLEISRFITQGRNFGLSFIASTQRLASVDINLIEVSGIRYFFRLSGQRNLMKARYWLNKYSTWNLRNLETGQTYLEVEGKIKLLRLPLFKATQKVIA